MKKELAELEKKTCSSDFYSDKAKTESIFRQINQKKYWLSNIEKADNYLEEIEMIFEMIDEEEEENLNFIEELNKTAQKFQELTEELELRGMLSRAEDKKDCIFTIHAGSGGTEAQDWAEILERMYLRFFDKMELKAVKVDFLPGDIGGVKTVTYEVSGDYAYGFLKCESGVHRLIRISPFDAAHKRHTSFASVSVIPESEDIEVNLDMKDVRIDTYRASGAGGQHVNKTDSAVRMTHLPTGITAQSQSQRSQLMNKEYALKVLKAKLYEQKLEEEKDRMAALEGQKKDISWGSQIRTYTFHPYSLVKDHRTNIESGNIGAVMDGELEKFVKGYLLQTKIIQ